MSNGGNYVYALGLDTAAFAQSVDKAKRMFQGLGDTATAAGEEADEAFNKMKNSIASVAAGVSLGMLVKKIAEVRGEVQQLEVAFETMLGSKQKADALMAQMVELAAKTPFGLQDVTNAAKQLLAFGSTVEQVADEIVMIGDIASGLSIPLGDLIYLYGTTRTQGGLFTQDLKQFMQRGIPLADELAKVMGITADEVRELVSAGKVGFPEVQKALQSMTSEGGQFGGLMAKQAETITGQISALQDAIYQMFNEIGKSNEGVISAVLSGASWIVEHYEAILKILSKVVIAWGAYKAALIVVAATQKIVATAQFVQRLYNVAKGAQAAAQAFRVLNTAMKSNPWGLIASIAATVIAFIWDWVAGLNEAAEATEETTRVMGELEQAAHDEYIEVNKLAFRLKDANTSETERREILKQLKEINPSIVEGLNAEALAVETLTRNLEKYNFEQTKRVQLAAITDRQNEALKNKADIELLLADENLALKKSVDDIIAKYQTSGTLSISYKQRSNWFNDESLEEGKAELESNIKRLIERRISGELTDIDFAKEIQAADNYIRVYGATGGWFPFDKFFYYDVSDIIGNDYVNNIKKITDDLNKANEELKKETENSEYLLNAFGFLDEPDAGGGDGANANLDKAYKEAQKAWLDAKAAVAEANKNRANYTEEQYKALVTQLDEAEKKFKSLGGDTSSKAQSIAEKDAKAAAELALKLEYEAQQAVIDTMAEGTEKKVAQIELDYRKRADAITKAEAELAAKQGTALTEAQQALFQTMREGSANDYAEAMNAAIFGDTDAQGAAAIQKMEAERKAWNKYLEEYGTFQEKLKAITIRYNEAIANAQTEGERKTLEAERDAALAAFEVQASAWAKELSNKSIAQLNKMMQELEEQVEAKQKAYDALESSDSAEAKNYLKTINMLNAKIAELEKQLSGANKEAKGGNWEGAAQVVQGIASAASEAANALEGVDDELANTINSMAKFANVAANLVSAIAAVTAASTALNMALGVIGLIATAIQVISTAIGSIVQERNEVEKAIAEFSKRMKELNDELERMRRLGEIDSLKGTIFGEDAFGNLMNNLAVMRDALSELEDVQNRITDHGNYTNDTLNFYDGVFANYEEVLRYLVGDRVPELFEGGLTLEKLQTWRETEGWGAGISYELRELIDELIADWERYEETVTAVNDYLTDIFGEMGNSINDAIVEAFINGADAAEAFGDIAGEVIENLIKQVGYSAYIAPILTKAMADVEALNGQGFSSEEYLNALMGIVGDAMGAAESQLEEYNKFLENADQYAESVGVNTFDSERSAQSKGIAQASQDSVDELNGRMTAIQGHTYALMEGQRQLINDSAQVLRHLAGIESNTAELRHMRQDMAAMRSDINDIATRGIITR